MLGTVPADLGQALETRWEARLAFEILSVDSQQRCVSWIDQAPTQTTRCRRIAAVLDLLQPSPLHAERRCRDGLGNLDP